MDREAQIEDIMNGIDDEALEATIKAVARRKSEGRVVPELLLSGIYKLATNPIYDLKQESAAYAAFLEKYKIDSEKHTFKGYFMRVMTGQDPTLQNLGLRVAERVLNNDGSFINDSMRTQIAADGRDEGRYKPAVVQP